MSNLTIERVDNLNKILNLDIVDIEEQGECTKQDIFEQFLNNCELTQDLDHITQYTELWLIRNFDISYNNDNFDLSDFETWELLFHTLTENTTESILIVQLIISLCKSSIINLQKLANCTEVKIILKNLLFNEDDIEKASSQTIEKLIELYSALISTKSNTRETLNLAQQLPSPNAFSVFDNICNNLNELPFINRLIFENHYHHIKSPPKTNLKIKDYTIQLWIELNNVTSNRIMSIGENLIVEIRDEKLCLCNQEFMLAIFESFKFEISTLYQISLIFKHKTNEWALYVNKELINTLTLFDDTVATLNSFEVGSIICSFKLYSLKIWSIEISQSMVKFINKLGPHYNPLINSNDKYWGCLNLFEDNFLEQMYIRSESTYIQFEQFEKDIKQLDLTNLLIDYNLVDTIKSYRKSNTSYELHFEYEDDLTLGKCFFFQMDNIQSKLIAINIFKSIIYHIEQCSSPDIIFQYVSLVITLCKDPQLMLFFEKSVGFDQLSYILWQHYIEKFKRGLPINFLNLFLQFCGWNFASVEDSMLTNLKAYKHLVMDFNLWNYSVNEKEGKDETIELIRYLFFHVSILQNDNKFREYNIIQLKRLDTFSNLCYSLYHNKNDCLQEISNEIILSIYNFIVNDSNHDYFKLSWQFVILFLENNDLGNVKIFGDVLSQILDHWITINDFNVLNTVPIPLLLHIINVFCHKNLPITIVLKILLQELSFERTFCRNFMKKNGIRLIFGTLTQCNTNELFDMISMILKFSINKNITSKSTKYDVSTIQFATSDTNLPFLYLSINLIEWMVQNDILLSADNDLNDFIETFFDEVIEYINEDESGNLKFSNILPLMSSLLVTLTKSTNTDIYQETTNKITNFLANEVITNIKLPESIGKFATNLTGFDLFFDDNYIKHHSLEDSNFLDLMFFQTILPKVMAELLIDEPKFLTELENRVQIIQNILELLDTFKGYFLIILVSPETIIQLYELLLICGEVLILSFPKSTKTLAKYHSLLTYYSKSYCWMVLNKNTSEWSDKDMERFDTNLVKYQAAIYGYVPHNKVSDVAQYLLYTSLYQLCKGRNSPMLIPATRALITFNIKNLEATLGHMHQQDLVLRTFLEEFLSSNDETILSKVHNILDSILSENTVSVYKGLIVEELSINFKSKALNKYELTKKIVERKEKYCNFIHSESKTLNELMTQDVLSTTNKNNKILWKKCNNYLISLQENIKVQENRINKLNGEMEHLQHIRNGDKIKNLAIDTEENSERMRLKLIPFYNSNSKR